MKQQNDLVEDVCKEFRMALSSEAQKPIIASYLGRVPVAAKEQLLQKLVE